MTKKTKRFAETTKTKTKFQRDVDLLGRVLEAQKDNYISPYQNTILPTYIYHNTTKASREAYPLIVLIQKIPNHRPASFYMQCECLEDALFYRNFILDHIGRDNPDGEFPRHYRGPSNPIELLNNRIPWEIASPQCFIESTDDLHPPYYI